jgi:DNA-binding NarL/FixJ family response regulator
MIAAIPPNKDLLKGTVLLVEDDLIYGSWIQDALNSIGLKCEWKKDLPSALEAANEKSYHALITDAFLSPNNIPEGLELIRKLEPQGIPTILMSSRTDLAIAKEAVNKGTSFILEKPFPIEDITSALRTLWEQPRGLQALLERFMEINTLTPKEREVTRLVIKGLANKEIASVEETTDRTVKAHLTNIFQKCGVESRTELFNAIFPT